MRLWTISVCVALFAGSANAADPPASEINVGDLVCTKGSPTHCGFVAAIKDGVATVRGYAQQDVFEEKVSMLRLLQRAAEVNPVAFSSYAGPVMMPVAGCSRSHRLFGRLRGHRCGR